MPNRTLYAAVDLGSNSFHMLVARREHGEMRVIDRIREMVRIAGGLDADGRLDEATRERALDCLARFGQRLAEIPREHVRAVGTQTFRRLKHPQRFLIVAETALGVPIDVISGREEARLVWLGVTGGTAAADRPRLVIDIGGGSTELVGGRALEPEFTESLQFGCVGVTRKAFGKGRISKRRWMRAGEEIATELQALHSAAAPFAEHHAIGSSGTVRAIQAIVAALDGNLPGDIRREQVDRLADRIIGAGHNDRIDLPGLSPRRAPVIAGGVLLLHSCMKALDIKQLEVSPYALREGLLHDMVGRLEQRDPREHSVAAMAERFAVDRAQAERVRDFALAGFEQIAENAGLARVHRDLLEWACALHEIGLGIAHSQYQIHSAYIVEHSDMAGFSRQEQQLMAMLLRHQRRKLPADALAALPERLHAPGRALLALIRLAVLLARARSDADLPDFALTMPDPGRLRLGLPPGWPAAHPLSTRGLRLERTQLRHIDLALEFAALGRDFADDFPDRRQ